LITLPCPICFQDASFSSDGTGKCHYCGTNWFIDEHDMEWAGKEENKVLNNKDFRAKHVRKSRRGKK